MAKRFPMVLGLLVMFALGIYAGGVAQPRTAQAAGATAHTNPALQPRVATSIVYISDSETCANMRAAQTHLYDASNSLQAAKSNLDYLNYIHWHGESWIATTGVTNALYTDVPTQLTEVQRIINALNSYMGYGYC